MSEGYLLNTVQTATTLPVAYRSIRNGHGTVEDIQDDTQLSKNQVSDALSGLQLVRLVEKIGEYRAVDHPIQTGNPEVDFRLSVLHNVAKEARPSTSEWGKQSALLVNFEYLVDSNTQFFNRQDQAIADDMNAFQQQLEYHPTDRNGDRNDMNTDKLTNWTRTAKLLGLVRQAQGTDFTTYPDPELLYATMRLATSELDDPAPSASEYDRIEIQEYFEWLRKNFLRVSLTEDNNVPEILARVFEYLSDLEEIRLVEAGDASSVGLVNTPNPPTMAPSANSIEVR